VSTIDQSEACPAEQLPKENLVRTARLLTRGLSKRRPPIYWSDFLLAHTLGAMAFYWTVAWGTPWAVRGMCFGVCVLLWYRSFAFIHEVVHLPPGQLRGFRTAWNLLAGIPFLCPSFMYFVHLEHHSRSVYGTNKDGEYIPWGVQPPAHILLFPLLSLLAPPLALFRIVVLVPISWLSPALRVWLEQRASSLLIRSSYRRASPGRKERRVWRMQENCAFLWALSLLSPAICGFLSWRWLLTGLCLMMTISFVNSLRTMLSHKFRNSDGPLTFPEQIEDSWNHPGGGLLTELLCPVGLRFHALHHMLPDLPYHSLPEAHALLMRTLPADSLYRRTNSPGLWCSMRTLWSEASGARRARDLLVTGN
jgi:Fatty acid desaturase